MHDLVQIVEGHGRLRAPALGFKEENLPDQPQRVQPSFFRWDEKFDMIGKENEPDLVVVANGAKREQAGDLRRQFALAEMDAAEVARSADIDNEHDRQFALPG